MKPKKEWAWSYSAFGQHKKCARQYKYARVDKLPQPQSAAIVNGNNKHSEGEAYLKFEVDEVPESYQDFAVDLAYCRDAGAEAEKQYVMRRDWSAAPEGWWDKSTWLRLKIDMFLPLNKSGSRVKITDFKTGKVREGEYDLQLDLYATVIFTARPEVKEIISDLWFLEQDVILDSSNDKTIPEVYVSADADNMRRKWTARANVMEADKRHTAKKSWLCAYCHFSNEHNGGPCNTG